MAVLLMWCDMDGGGRRTAPELCPNPAPIPGKEYPMPGVES